jgi:hypothetical protein
MYFFKILLAFCACRHEYEVNWHADMYLQDRNPRIQQERTNMHCLCIACAFIIWQFKHERDCHSRWNYRDGMRWNGMINGIDENKIFTSVSLKPHSWIANENRLYHSLVRMNEIYRSFSVVYSKINFQLHGVWMGLTRFNEIDVNWTMFDQDISSRVYDIDVLEWDLPR